LLANLAICCGDDNDDSPQFSECDFSECDFCGYEKVDCVCGCVDVDEKPPNDDIIRLVEHDEPWYRHLCQYLCRTYTNLPSPIVDLMLEYVYYADDGECLMCGDENVNALNFPSKYRIYEEVENAYRVLCKYRNHSYLIHMDEFCDIYEGKKSDINAFITADVNTLLDDSHEECVHVVYSNAPQNGIDYGMFTTFSFSKYIDYEKAKPYYDDRYIFINKQLPPDKDAWITSSVYVFKKTPPCQREKNFHEKMLKEVFDYKMSHYH
jgi:hypothetical protein